ncbi:hypothetical protein [Rhizobium laguerreae]|nr:hypothetical protein [Rhizobium laguerreae]MBY3407576.1 hypothetical protein [Rhizobium laguerreae]
MWLRDANVLGTLCGIGKPRILKIAVPLPSTVHTYSAAVAVIATYARSLGCIPSKGDFDLYATAALPATAILSVHSDGEPTFGAMGCGYPEGYTDVNIGRWKELTGE